MEKIRIFSPKMMNRILYINLKSYRSSHVISLEIYSIQCDVEDINPCDLISFRFIGLTWSFTKWSDEANYLI